MPLTQTAAELSAWLRLSLEPNVGPATACTLLSALGLPEQIYAQRPRRWRATCPKRWRANWPRPCRRTCRRRWNAAWNGPRRRTTTS